MTTAADLDLGDFEDEAPAPKPEVVGLSIEDDGEPSDVALDVLNELAGDDAPAAADKIELIFADAKLAAMTPKPTLREMIAEICDAANRLEDSQRALMRAGVCGEPHAPYMRKAAVLDAAQKFLLLIENKGDAVKRVLRGGR